jgi:hypothetical protein
MLAEISVDIPLGFEYIFQPIFSAKVVDVISGEQTEKEVPSV